MAEESETIIQAAEAAVLINADLIPHIAKLIERIRSLESQVESAYYDMREMADRYDN